MIKKLLKIKLIYHILIGLVFLASSANGENGSSGLMRVDAISPAPQVVEVGIERKPIKEGNVGFETNDRMATRKLIIESVAKYKGYVSAD